jgi:DNA-binding NtrC family response regulator
VRIVAATHRDLRAAVADGRFRQDLYYRLSAMVLHIPPLRERRREIPLLADRFAAEVTKQAGARPASFSPRAMAALQAYDWPGNIRELRNVVSAAAVTCSGGEIELRHLPEDFGGEAEEPSIDTVDLDHTSEVQAIKVPLEDELRTIERRRIVAALEQCDGNQTQAAKLLGMPRRTLVRKLGALDIDVSRKGKRR